ncbi:hypothetical protein GWK47_015838 [Chionoecetes opilio]|uniref:Uncharacterized protein n=1 Tax=Chionoecetes opilio TaxID=41210 RepID=A0A8J5CJY5_CHIOP|nr:hypothetical protein GWK47_015838 [Chionoecetes opilio]
MKRCIFRDSLEECSTGIPREWKRNPPRKEKGRVLEVRGRTGRVRGAWTRKPEASDGRRTKNKGWRDEEEGCGACHPLLMGDVAWGLGFYTSPIVQEENEATTSKLRHQLNSTPSTPKGISSPKGGDPFLGGRDNLSIRARHLLRPVRPLRRLQ